MNNDRVSIVLDIEIEQISFSNIKIQTLVITDSKISLQWVTLKIIYKL